MASNVRRRRAFGKIAWKPNKQHPTRIEGVVPHAGVGVREMAGTSGTSIEELPASADGEDEARGWLGRQKRLIDAEAWEPERVVRRKDLAERITFGEYWEGWHNGRRTAKGRSAGCRYTVSAGEGHSAAPAPLFRSHETGRCHASHRGRLACVAPQDQKAMRANAIKAAHAIFATAAKPGAHGEPPLIPLESLRRPYGRQIPSRQGDASGDTGGAEGDA